MTKFYTRNGKHKPITGRTLYQETKNKRLGAEVEGKTVPQARASVEDLRADFDRAKSRDKKVEIYHATLEEANRAKVNSTNTNNGEAARFRQRQVEHIFRTEADKMHNVLY